MSEPTRALPPLPEPRLTDEQLHALVVKHTSSDPVMMASGDYCIERAELRALLGEFGEVCAREATERERERAAKLCEDEAVDADETQQEGDFAYNRAVRDCAEAIRKGSGASAGDAAAEPVTIREAFDLMADAHMGVFGMKNSPARACVWDALEAALQANVAR